MSTQDVDIDALVGGRRRPRRWFSLIVIAVAAVVAVAAFLLTRGEEEAAVFEPQEVTATSGRLTTTVELSGSAAAAQSSNLSFAVAGHVASIEVAAGDEVSEGDVLARLDPVDAERQLETAQVNLELARLRMEDLVDSPTGSQIAAAERALATAQAQLVDAQLRLDEIDDPPDEAARESAEQAVANARKQLSSADQALAELSEGANPGQIARAEQAVANAASQLSSAEEALADLVDEPSAADIASAEQAVASARQQLISAERSLDSLHDANVADIESARAAAVQARNPLEEANTAIDSTWDALGEAQDDFCDDISVLPEICAADLPLSDDLLEVLDEHTENTGQTLIRRARSLIAAQEAWVLAVNSEEAARASLAAAEARLEDVTAGPEPEAIAQANDAVAAAQASLRAAEARLDDLLTPASDADIFQAEQAIAAARAGLASARNDLDELLADPDADEVFQAQQASAAARSSLEAAEANYRDLLAPPTDGDVLEAELAVASAQSSLAEAQAKYDELIAGPTANAIAQQAQNVRLAEINLEQADQALRDLDISAPFGGVVEELNIGVGDRVAAGATAVVISTRRDVVVSLTVTEAEIFELEEQQVGVAAFDAISGAQYPVRISSISRVPNVDQGVVTYAVEASVLSPLEIQQVRAELQALGVTVPEPQAAARGGAGAARGGADAGAAGEARARQLGALLQTLDLPPGVSLLEVVQAIANDDPLPQGVDLPPDFDIADEERAQLRAFMARFGGGGAAGGAAAVAEDRQLPVDGMSASVIILTAVRDQAVLVATSAVRQIDGAHFVAVPDDLDGWRRQPVQIGESDGTNVEILEGVAAGDTLLVGVDSEGLAYSATQLPGGAGGLPTPPGGGGGGGAGGGR